MKYGTSDQINKAIFLKEMVILIEFVYKMKPSVLSLCIPTS